MLMCFVVVFSLLFVVLFANYGAIEVEDKETRASRNVGICVAMFVIVMVQCRV